MTNPLIYRTAAVGAALSGILHLLMITHGPIGWGLLMAIMAITCLPCAGHLWRRPTLQGWMIIGIMNAGMVAVHIGLLTRGAHGHGHPSGTGELVEELQQSADHAGHGHAALLTFDPGMIFFLSTIIALLEVVAATTVISLFLVKKSKWTEPALHSTAAE